MKKQSSQPENQQNQLTDENRTYMTEIQEFRMPAYSEIPDVGLYLDQVTKFVAAELAPIHCVNITRSMISNYVKKKLVRNPVKKQYDRDQIAVILFIATAKTVISLEEVQMLLEIQKENYSVREAYEVFCREFRDALQRVFELQDDSKAEPEIESTNKKILRNVMIAVAHKECLSHSFQQLAEQRS